MARTELVTGLGVFALIVVVVLVGTSAVGALMAGSPTETTTLNASAYHSQNLVPQPVDDNGSVAAPNTTKSKTIVIDKSHGNAISEDQLQPLVDALVHDGDHVLFYTGGQSQGFSSAGGLSGSSDLNSTLETADAFVVANPSNTYTEGEINGIESFADAGGRVLLLADPVSPSGSTQSVSIPLIGSSSGSSVTPGQPTNLAARFGISFGAGYLYDMQDNANNFQRIFAQPVGNDTLTDGADRLVFDAATPLTTSRNATRLVESTAHVSSTRKADTFTIAARVGNVTTVGDTGFLAPESATVADNDYFVGNLARFLVTGDKASGAPETSQSSSGPGGISSPYQPPGGSSGTTMPSQPPNSTSP
ncbi:MAG: hypothetical protein ABEI77_07915 [Halorientalis sp.]